MIARDGESDTASAMIYDLRTILEGWEYEPGKISVRKIIGRDGREKIQTRVDLGILQLETTGRPDGSKPFGCELLLDHVERKLRELVRRSGDDQDFSLTREECRELRHEAHLLYQRYLALFVLEEFAGVERDTARSLRIIDLCMRYGEEGSDREALESQRGYVLMMNTRARAYGAAKLNRFEEALATVREGIQALREPLGDEGDTLDDDDNEAELRVLESLEQELLEQMPGDAAPRLRHELEIALESEDYERAAEIRDRLSTLGESAD